MFREMRRGKQQLPEEAAMDILVHERTGVLGVSGDDGYPYTVPLNYVYDAGSIYFHCAKAGHKLDAMRKNAKVSFCVIAEDQVIPAEFTTYFRSVVAFGRAAEVTEDQEKRRVMRLLNEKYSPGLAEAGEKEVEKNWAPLCVVGVRVDHLTGKEAKELQRLRK